MIIISHRGNTNGESELTANSPDAVSALLDKGIHCEVDVWKVFDKYFLGHDEPKYKINIETSEHIATKNLELNDIGNLVLTTVQEIPFTSYQEDRELGGFILIDKVSNITVAAGLINFALRRSQNIHWQTADVTK